MFGESISITWNGEDTYKTMPGATLSWIILIIMAAYSIYRIIYMVNRWNPAVAKTTLIKTAEEDLPFSPSETGFDFAFSLNNNLDPTYGNFTVRYINQTVVNGVRNKTTTDLSFELCGDEHFTYIDPAEVNKYKINTYQCVKNIHSDWQLQGNYYRDEMLYLEIKLRVCKNNTADKSAPVCASQANITEYFRKE